MGKKQRYVGNKLSLLEDDKIKDTIAHNAIVESWGIRLMEIKDEKKITYVTFLQKTATLKEFVRLFLLNELHDASTSF